VLLMNAGKNDPPNPPIVYVFGSRERFPAIYRHEVPPICKLRAELLGELLEPTVTIGDSPGPDNGDFQGRPSAVDLPLVAEAGTAASESIARGASENHHSNLPSDTRLRVWTTARFLRTLLKFRSG